MEETSQTPTVAEYGGIHCDWQALRKLFLVNVLFHILIMSGK